LIRFLRKPLLGLLFWFLTAMPLSAFPGQVGQTPDSAYDPLNDRYLMVWSQNMGSGEFQIMGKFLNPKGSDQSPEPIRLSPERPTQGCFYQGFDAQNGLITTPTNCPQNLNPAVAYNDGKYLIVWEVHGTAGSPFTSPENEFINTFARIVNADELDPISGWEEGIVISKIFIAANNSDSCGNGKFACNDSEIQAWSQSHKAHVAPRIGEGGFVVTWETNKDFIGCASADRRGGRSVYGRYIDQTFSATSTSNPAMFAIFKDDSTMDTKCAPLANVENATQPRLAYNAGTDDFVAVYEIGRADGGRKSIGAKRFTLDENKVGQVAGSMMPGIMATSDGNSLTAPDLAAFGDRYVLVASDGDKIRIKGFSSNAISNSDPASLNLGNGTQRNGRITGNLGTGGAGPVEEEKPERLLVAYEQDGEIFGAVLDEDFTVTAGPSNISQGVATDNSRVGISSDGGDFMTVWQGMVQEMEVFPSWIDVDANVPTPLPTPEATPDPTPPASPVPSDPPCDMGVNSDGDEFDDCTEIQDGDPWTDPNIFNGMHVRQKNQCGASGNCSDNDTLAEVEACMSGGIQEELDQYSGWDWDDPPNNLCDVEYDFQPNWSVCDSTWQADWQGYINLVGNGQHCFGISGSSNEACGSLFFDDEINGIQTGLSSQCFNVNAGVYPIRWHYTMDNGSSSDLHVNYCFGGGNSCVPNTAIPSTILRVSP